MQLFYLPALGQCKVGQSVPLADEEARHCLKVLRMKEGDTLHFTNGQGLLAEARIAVPDFKRCLVELTGLQQQPPLRPFSLHLVVAPVKNAERMEWMVEKCVEIGVDRLSFVLTKHTERDYFNLGRIEKKALAAMKQSLQCWLPAIAAPVELPKFLAQCTDEARMVAYVDSSNPLTLFATAQARAAQSYCVLIGPEGDFTPDELAQTLQAGFEKVSLGPTRLRTETAALVACHSVHLARTNKT